MSRAATHTPFLLVGICTLPVVVYAAEFSYAPLTGDIPFLGDTFTSLSDVWNAFLMISIVIAAILAVIMLAVGGFKYMASESVFKVQGAKEQMANAIIGLLIVLAAILILVTINSNIINFGFFA
jgi:hypothetical protein